VTNVHSMAGPYSSYTDVVRTDDPSVAVVITTYNHAHFLADAIESVLDQTQLVADILVVDDGSMDDPAAVVSRYPKVRLIQQSNQGLAAARNTGLRAVCSEKVIFLDADDRLLPNAIVAGSICFARAPQSGFVYGGHRRIDQEGRPLGENRYTPISGKAYIDLLRGNPIGMHATVMYDRNKLMESGGFDPSLLRCEDYAIYIRMARSYPVASHPEIVAEYRWHGSNMSANYREMLTWVLRVHGREAVHAIASSETASDWRCGRQIWRCYYAGQILDATKANWANGRSLVIIVRGVIQAMTASPRLTSRRLVRVARKALLKGIRGKRPRLRLGSVRFGDLDRVTPISSEFGFDRGTPVDRYYIEQFLKRHATDIRGRVLEIGDDSYCRRFGATRIEHQDVLHVTADNPTATIVGDLSQRGILPADTFDCLLLTQTLHLIFDMRAAIIEMHSALKSGGTVLLTAPGISQIDRGTWGETWFWSLTRNSALRLFSEVFGSENVCVEARGNVFAATAFLQGLAVEELDAAKLQFNDECYPVIVSVRAQKIGDT
jgi:glycosyltransferase involved in cell wall biosynthesis